MKLVSRKESALNYVEITVIKYTTWRNYPR